MSIQSLNRFLHSCRVFTFRLSSNLLSTERLFSIKALCPNAKAIESTESTGTNVAFNLDASGSELLTQVITVIPYSLASVRGIPYTS